MSLFSVFWTLQEFPKPSGLEPESYKTYAQSAQSQEAQGGLCCLRTRGGLPVRTGALCCPSQGSLRAPSAEQEEDGAPVSATWCAKLHTLLGTPGLRLYPATARERMNEG